MNKLLTFAHLGEARAFIDFFEAEPLKSHHLKIFKASSGPYLLITGEGLRQSSESLMLTLGSFPEIEEIINFGLAGSLNKNLNIGDIYSVRSIYAENPSEIEYHSFTTSDGSAKVDLISTYKRIFDSNKAKKLSILAALVDLEAWAIASGAKRQNLPFKSFKIISDHPLNEENSKVICEDIREQAYEFSRKLLEFYLEHVNSSEALKKEDSFSLPSDFRLSFSMEKEFQKLFKNLLATDPNFHPLEISKVRELRKQKLLPKEKGKKLLEILRNLSNPKREELKQNLKNLISPFEHQGLKSQFHPQFEDESVTLKFQLQSLEEKEKMKQLLTNYPLKDIQKLLRGEHVS